MKMELDQNFSGNEVYNTNSSILFVKNMMCSKLHCQKGLLHIRAESGGLAGGMCDRDRGSAAPAPRDPRLRAPPHQGGGR
jgi:hypothetical protein